MPNGECPIGARHEANIQRNTDDIRIYKQELIDVDAKVDGLINTLIKFKAEIKTSIRWLAIIGGIFMTFIGPMITAGLMYLTKVAFGG